MNASNDFLIETRCVSTVATFEVLFGIDQNVFILFFNLTTFSSSPTASTMATESTMCGECVYPLIRLYGNYCGCCHCRCIGPDELQPPPKPLICETAANGNKQFVRVECCTEDMCNRRLSNPYGTSVKERVMMAYSFPLDEY